MLRTCLVVFMVLALPALAQSAGADQADLKAWNGAMDCAAQQGVQLPPFGMPPTGNYTPAENTVIEGCIKASGLGQAQGQAIPAAAQKQFQAASQCAEQSGVDLPATGGPPSRPFTQAEDRVIAACLKTAGLGPDASPHQSAAEKAAAQKIEAQYRAAQSCAIQQNVQMPPAGNASALVNPSEADIAVIMACLQANGLGPQTKSAQ